MFQVECSQTARDEYGNSTGDEQHSASLTLCDPANVAHQRGAEPAAVGHTLKNEIIALHEKRSSNESALRPSVSSEQCDRSLNRDLNGCI